MNFHEVNLNEREALLYDALVWQCIELAPDWFYTVTNSAVAEKTKRMLHICKPRVWSMLANTLGTSKAGFFEQDDLIAAMQHLGWVEDDKCSSCGTKPAKRTLLAYKLMALGENL